MEWVTAAIRPDRVPKHNGGLATIALVLGQPHYFHHLFCTHAPGQKHHTIRTLLTGYARWLRGLDLEDSVHQVDHDTLLTMLEAEGEIYPPFHVHDALALLEQAATFPEQWPVRGTVVEYASSGPLASLVYDAVRERVAEEGGGLRWRHPVPLKDPSLRQLAGLTPVRHDTNAPLLFTRRLPRHRKGQPPMSLADVTVYPSPIDRLPLPVRMQFLRDQLLVGTSLDDIVAAMEAVFPSTQLGLLSPSGYRQPAWTVPMVIELRAYLHADPLRRQHYEALVVEVLRRLPASHTIDPGNAFTIYATEYMRVRLLEATYLLGLSTAVEIRLGRDSDSTFRTELRDVHATLLTQAVRLNWLGAGELTDFLPPVQLVPNIIRGFYRVAPNLHDQTTPRLLFAPDTSRVVTLHVGTCSGDCRGRCTNCSWYVDREGNLHTK